MVFRGKPSKACERCRARRLKCDHASGTCGPCVRAGASCSGYRDTQALRIRNESRSVAEKALKTARPLGLPSRPLSVDLQARDAFFSYYVTGTSRCWDFLKPYYHPKDSPDHLTLAIEAVSSAYLWHQVHSEAALATARERYVSALRTTNKILKSSKEVGKNTTLLASLLLDLFEKITVSERRNDISWISHVSGALALVRLRGPEQFQDPSEIRVLVRFIHNHITTCVASGSPVPDELVAIRAYVEEHLDIQCPSWRLSGLMAQYTSLRSEIRKGCFSDDECIEAFMELDLKLQAEDLGMPPSWKYSTTYLDHRSDRAFDLHFDSYTHRNICQARNGLRLGRILLNESVIDYSVASPGVEKYSALIEAAQNSIATMVGEICASVPQYIDCDSAARHRLPASDHTYHQVPDHGPRDIVDHPHTPTHQADAYTLIFPLYAAGRSKAASPPVRTWVIKQLRHISNHFHVRNAEIVAQILESEIDVCPWDIYTMLGSYAIL